VSRADDFFFIFVLIFIARQNGVRTERNIVLAIWSVRLPLMCLNEPIYPMM